MTEDQMETPAMSRERAVKELSGLVCRGCDGAKRSGMSHCQTCYFKLPRAMRRALYRLVGHGYEQAYADSLRYLSTGAPSAP